MKVLVTGGAGFIGSTVVRRLLAGGQDVQVLDNLETGKLRNLPADVLCIKADVRDEAAVRAACVGCELVIHLAAMVSVSLSTVEPERCFDINVSGTRNVLAAARGAGCRRVVLASSAAVYGDEPTLPKREDMPAMPLSPYAYAKWQNEIDAAYFQRFCGLETVCLRFFNVFGPRQDPASPYSGVISIAARRLLSQQPFTVFGDGLQTRDFVFVEDVAAALLAAAQSPQAVGSIINVGRGERVTLLQLVQELSDVIGVQPALQFADPRAGDVRHSLSDVTRLRTQLGIHSQVDLKTGLATTIDWMRSEPDAA
ncbi:MAG: NAD-dependent epimerase/dehydratase family protein [Myxococcales bacterium]|nr:NAD-dependent epimerase/dehydratase family protein [Myxococcales bacterium]